MTPTVALVDLDGDVEHVLRVLDEVLVALADVIADERGADPSWEPPAGLDRLHDFYQPGASDDSFARIWRAVRDAGERPGKVFAPDGHYEHLPLRVIHLDPTDVERFGAALAALGTLVAAGDTIVTDVIVERAAGVEPPR